MVLIRLLGNLGLISIPFSAFMSYNGGRNRFLQHPTFKSCIPWGASVCQLLFYGTPHLLPFLNCFLLSIELALFTWRAGTLLCSKHSAPGWLLATIQQILDWLSGSPKDLGVLLGFLLLWSVQVYDMYLYNRDLQFYVCQGLSQHRGIQSN